MVTVKRKINSETERYGGFSELEIKAPMETEKFGDSFIEAQQRKAEASVVYSPAPQMTNDIKPTVQETPAPVVTPTVEEFMPTIRSEKQEEATMAAPAKRQKLDGRTKLILGIYLSVILVLSALVIATGAILSSAGTRVENLESELAVRNAVIAEQLSEIASLSDEDAIAGRAFNSGMERIQSSETIDLLPLGDAPTYEGTTNWFDSFCDWLSGVFGG